MDADQKLKVSKAEWAEANAFFNAHKKAVKFRKADTKGGKEGGRSFVRIGTEIYAVNNEKRATFTSFLGMKSKTETPEMDAGKGAMGRVKIGVTEDGKIIAIKVSTQNTAYDKSKMAALKKRGYVLGQEMRDTQAGEKGIIRTSGGGQAQAGGGKVYTAMPYIEGSDVSKAVTGGMEAAILALLCEMEIYGLHQAGYLHRDIKGDNFMFADLDDHFTVLPVDYDAARSISQEDTRIIFTRAYAAPEVFNPSEPNKSRGEYSTASEVYALGHTLRKDLKLPKELYEDMIKPNPKDRITLPQAMEKLAHHIEDLAKKQRVPDPAVQHVLAQYQILSEQIAYSQQSYFKQAKTALFGKKSPAAVAGASAQVAAPSKPATKQVGKVSFHFHEPAPLLNKKQLTSLTKALEQACKELQAMSRTFTPNSPAVVAFKGPLALFQNEKQVEGELANSAVEILLGALINIREDKSMKAADKMVIDSTIEQVTQFMVEQIDPEFRAPNLSQMARRPER